MPKKLDQEQPELLPADPTLIFSRPRLSLLLMLVFVSVVGALGAILAKSIMSVFWANPALNGLILIVALIGIGLAFWQLWRLFRAIDWLEGFATDRDEILLGNPPSILASMAALLRDRRARKALTATSARSVLDSVASRLDESGEIIRYIIGLLIFLGLLGTFWGLSNTVPAVVDTIRSMAPREGEVFDFAKLMNALERQLGGMSTAFASSLLGLAGSMIIGLLELIAGRAQNRFFGDFENWLSSITRIAGGGTEDGAPGSAYLSALLEQNAEQMEALNKVMARGEEKRAASNARLTEIASRIEHVAEQMADSQAVIARLAHAQEKLVEVLSALHGRDSLDEETRKHIRNMDLVLMRMLEESAAGRAEAVSEIRQELKVLTKTLAVMADRSGPRG